MGAPMSNDAVSLAAQAEETRQNLAEMKQVLKNFVAIMNRKHASMLGDVMVVVIFNYELRWFQCCEWVGYSAHEQWSSLPHG